jgi:hypothetical protein
MLPEPTIGKLGVKVWPVGKDPPTEVTLSSWNVIGTAEAVPARTIETTRVRNSLVSKSISHGETPILPAAIVFGAGQRGISTIRSILSLERVIGSDIGRRHGVPATTRNA